MNKICLIFIGAIRECLDDINKNISVVKNTLKDKNCHVFLSTWYPEKEPQCLFGNFNYVYDYDIDTLKQKTEKIVDTFLFYKQKKLNEYPTLQNRAIPISLCNTIEISKSLKNMNTNFDYVVFCRHDIEIQIKNIDQYFNENFNVLPLYWIRNSNDMINDHFFITSFNNFLKYADLSDESVEKTVKSCWNNEMLWKVIMESMSKIHVVAEENISKYIVRKNRVYKDE